MLESGCRGSLPSKTSGVGIDSSSTGLQSATERSLVEMAVLVKTACLHHARHLLVCAPRAVHCAKQHLGFPATSV
eukprot:3147639-Pleurochrysis_carterae.AAC.1